MMPTLSDPLRAARDAVRAGRFRDAAVVLAELPAHVRNGPEWYLLSAMASWRLGDFAASRAQALQARSGYRARGDADGEMRALNVAAAGSFGLGALEEAEEGFYRALDLARELGDDLMLARCSNNLGNISLYLARHDAAQGFYRIARAGFERLGFHHGAAETWINTAITWRDLGRGEEALRAADRALDAAERAGSPRLLAEALSNRGAALAALGDPTLGRAQIERGLTLARAEDDRLAVADALRILAGLDAAAARYTEAERLGQEALAIAQDLGHPWTVAEIQRDRARHYRAAGRLEEARGAFAAAEAAFRMLGSVPRAEAVRREGEAD
jgi:tetratricopeptide (TPR) repeat protein